MEGGKSTIQCHEQIPQTNMALLSPFLRFKIRNLVVTLTDALRHVAPSFVVRSIRRRIKLSNIVKYPILRDLYSSSDRYVSTSAPKNFNSLAILVT